MSATILIIDDDLPQVKSLEKDLRSNGFEVLSAPDGMIGVQEALRRRPDLIILDLHFPAGGAFFVLNNLRRSLFTRDIPTLILTDFVDPLSQKRLLDLGVLTYIQKPCDRNVLLGEIRKVITTGDYESPLLSPQSPNTEAQTA